MHGLNAHGPRASSDLVSSICAIVLDIDSSILLHRWVMCCMCTSIVITHFLLDINGLNFERLSTVQYHAGSIIVTGYDGLLRVFATVQELYLFMKDH